MTRLLLALVMAFTAAIGLAPTASAELKVLVEGSGNFQPTPLAIPDFEVRGGTNTTFYSIFIIAHAARS